MIELYTFLHSTVNNFRETGAIIPSSSVLAKAMTHVVARKNKPAKILEVGAGTGTVTKHLINILGKNDTLDICEINEKFINCLEKKFQKKSEFREFDGNCRILAIDIKEINSKEKYDFIVSSLPLNAFDPETVQTILDVYLKSVKPWGWISYFEYIGIRPIKFLFSNSKEKESIKEISKITKNFIENNEIFHKNVFLNLPPAHVRHCQKTIC